MSNYRPHHPSRGRTHPNAPSSPNTNRAFKDRASKDRASKDKRLLDDVLDLLLVTFHEEATVFGVDPPPILFGIFAPDDSTPAPAHSPFGTLTAGDIDVWVKPLWGDDPIEAVAEFEAPPHWCAVGLVGPSAASIDSDRFDITLGLVIGRSGALSARLVDTDGLCPVVSPVHDDAGGILVDALRNALGLDPVGGWSGDRAG